MSLDINTPRGQVTLEQERRAAEIIAQTWPDCSYIHTPKDQAAAIDAVMAKQGIVRAVVLASCRNNSLNTLRTSFHDAWLLTYSKIIEGQRIAQAMCVELWGVLYLVPDDTVLRVKLWSPDGGWLVCFSVNKTETQATCNGGTALRDNAYIDMSAATVLPVRKTP
jgi:hypothetical protein